MAVEHGHVLVVDDDTEIRSMLRRTLLAEKFDVDTARTVAEGVQMAVDRRPDVIVMDIGLPDGDGVEAVRVLRERSLWAPVLVLTAHGEIERRVESFRAGADDFLTKPFHHDELVLRLQALIRRARGVVDDGARIRSGDTIIEASSRRCWRGTREIDLSPREFELLELLMRNAGTVLGRHHIADEIWSGEIVATSNAVDVYVGYLRRKLEAGGEPRVIRTVRGHGFMFAPVGGGA